MSLLRSAAAIAKKVVQHASITVPPNVQIAKQADQLIISGPLGTNRTCLSRLDSLGVAAVRLAPESRSIDICCADKAFFGTIQVNMPAQHPACREVFGDGACPWFSPG